MKLEIIIHPTLLQDEQCDASVDLGVGNIFTLNFSNWYIWDELYEYA